MGPSSYIYVVNHINIALSRKILRTNILFSKKSVTLLRVFARIGCIKNYLIFYKKGMYLQFTVFFYKNTPYYQGIRLVSTLSKKFYISLTALNKLVRLSQSSTYLISTPSGIITHREAILRKTGGILLCAIG